MGDGVHNRIQLGLCYHNAVSSVCYISYTRVVGEVGKVGCRCGTPIDGCSFLEEEKEKKVVPYHTILRCDIV